MNFLNKNISTINFFLVVIASSYIFFSSCKDNSMGGKLIITRVAAKIQNANYLNGDFWRYIPKAQIVTLDSNNSEASLKVLSTDFFSAQSPSISCNAKYMLFAGQLKENDNWQIWEMNLGNLKSRQITTSNENCTDPVYLPNGRLLYSRLNINDSLKAGHSLYTCNLDGSDNMRITFNPSTYFASNVLLDGRVLTIGKQIYPQSGDQMLMVLRHDGTKAEIYYNGLSESNLTTKARETSDGKIVFIESIDGKSTGGKLVSISYNRPLHSRVDLAKDLKGDFQSVFPVNAQKLLVSYRNSDSERYSLYEFDTRNNSIGKTIYSNTEFDVLDAIVVGEKARPKKLPSEVDMEIKTGLLLCQNINITDMQSLVGDSLKQKVYGIEVLGLDSSMGKVQVEADGSFYLKMIADKPFRIQTIDKEGNVLRGPGSWLYLRPLERRGCVGCHQDPELVPENKIPLAVKKAPVIIPVYLNNVVEKNVLLD